MCSISVVMQGKTKLSYGFYNFSHVTPDVLLLDKNNTRRKKIVHFQLRFAALLCPGRWWAVLWVISIEMKRQYPVTSRVSSVRIWFNACSSPFYVNDCGPPCRYTGINYERFQSKDRNEIITESNLHTLIEYSRSDANNVVLITLTHFSRAILMSLVHIQLSICTPTSYHWSCALTIHP